MNSSLQVVAGTTTMANVFALGEVLSSESLTEEKLDLYSQIRQAQHVAEMIDLSINKKSLKPYKVAHCSILADPVVGP